MQLVVIDKSKMKINLVDKVDDKVNDKANKQIREG